MSGSDIARRQDVYAWAEHLADVGELAVRIAGTDFVPKGMQGKPASVAACVLYGAEIGVGPMRSLAGIHVVEGRAAMSAELMRALVLAAGHDIRVVELTATRCVLLGTRRGSTDGTQVQYTTDDAKRAGVLGKQVWQRYPREMLLARCTTLLCRSTFPDVIGGMASVEEMDDAPVQQAEATVVEPAEPRRTVQRRTRPQRQVEQPERPAIEAVPVQVEDPPLDDEPEAEAVEMVTSAQLKKIGAAMRDQHMTDRAEALAYVSNVIGRDVSSRNELTKDEAHRLIEALEAVPLPPEPEVDPETGEVVPAELWEGES